MKLAQNMLMFLQKLVILVTEKGWKFLETSICVIVRSPLTSHGYRQSEFFDTCSRSFYGCFTQPIGRHLWSLQNDIIGRSSTHVALPHKANTVHRWLVCNSDLLIPALHALTCDYVIDWLKNLTPLQFVFESYYWWSAELHENAPDFMWITCINCPTGVSNWNSHKY